MFTTKETNYEIIWPVHLENIRVKCWKKHNLLKQEKETKKKKMRERDREKVKKIERGRKREREKENIPEKYMTLLHFILFCQFSEFSSCHFIYNFSLLNVKYHF